MRVQGERMGAFEGEWRGSIGGVDGDFRSNTSSA